MSDLLLKFILGAVIAAVMLMGGIEARLESLLEELRRLNKTSEKLMDQAEQKTKANGKAVEG